MPEEKYVNRVKEVVVETEILYHADLMDEPIEPKEVLECFRSRAERIDFDESDVREAVEALVGDGHLEKADGNRVRITADGRDDVRRTRELIRNFGNEIAEGVVCPGGREHPGASKAI